MTIKITDYKNKFCKSTLRDHENFVKCTFELDNGILLTGSVNQLKFGK